METAQRAVLFVDVTDSTRLYESLGELTMFFILLFVRTRKRFHGHVLLAYLFLYPLLRSFIESMRSGAVKYRKMTRGDVKVRTYGCIAIVTGRGSFEVTARGQDLKLELLFHAVWAKRASGVQFVSWQATRLPAA